MTPGRPLRIATRPKSPSRRGPAPPPAGAAGSAVSEVRGKGNSIAGHPDQNCSLLRRGTTVGSDVAVGQCKYCKSSLIIANIHCHCHYHYHCYNTQYRDGKTFPQSSIISRRSYNSVGRPVAIRSSQLASLCAAYVNTAPCQSVLGLTYIRPSQPAAQPQEQQPHNSPHSGPDPPLLRYRAVRPWCRPRRSIPSPKSASWRPGRSGRLHPAIRALPICTSQT